MKWKYKVISLSPEMSDIQKELDQMGSQEWELISIFTHTSEYVEQGEKRKSLYFAVFKQPFLI
jgi:hypothetical protein